MTPAGSARSLATMIAFLSIAITSTHAELIRVHGSDTLGAKLMPLLCELYKTKNQGVVFEISVEGTNMGFARLLDGTCDIAMASRDISPEETLLFAKRRIAFARIAAATDALVLAVNASNPLDELTSKQIEAIFTGDAVNWRQVGGHENPISIYAGNSSSGRYAEFQKLALHGRKYANSKMSDGESDLQSVVRDKDGITHIGLPYSRARGIKVLKINGFMPTVENQDSYPYIRRFYYFTRNPATPAVDAFLQWATNSNETLKLVEVVGFYKPKQPVAEQDGIKQPASRPKSKSEGEKKLQPASEERPR